MLRVAWCVRRAPVEALVFGAGDEVPVVPSPGHGVVAMRPEVPAALWAPWQAGSRASRLWVDRKVPGLPETLLKASWRAD